jgi:hypothetical protein
MRHNTAGDAEETVPAMLVIGPDGPKPVAVLGVSRSQEGCAAP